MGLQPARLRRENALVEQVEQGASAREQGLAKLRQPETMNSEYVANDNSAESSARVDAAVPGPDNLATNHAALALTTSSTPRQRPCWKPCKGYDPPQS